jgi:hypothetical protein
MLADSHDLKRAAHEDKDCFLETKAAGNDFWLTL